MTTDNISVAIKTRPLILREIDAKLKPVWAVRDRTIFQIDDCGHRLGEPYSFDHIFKELETNANVYEVVVEPLVKSFLNGFNSTIFAYGQTSSGKTHTMMGTGHTSGIIQMAINDVFEHVLRNPQRRYLISCSYFEIYNEKINDLLDKSGQDLKIREDFCGNIFLNAKEEVVTQQEQVYELMKVGNKIRKMGCTGMNERSSRSHTIFRLTIESTENNIENGPVQISQLNLVDLAGSERVTQTKAAGIRLREGVNINKSLLALGNVVRQLSEGEGFINYRDSNLTRLLQHALGGNAKSLIIATVTLAAGEETRSTLEFAQRAKVVKNKPVINEIQSEQDKLKQYELVTANYKNRLQKEKQRILEMEHEKEEREREILRLKQQVKLVDLFTNGPEVKKPQSGIPRRHTMGYYSRVPLQTIPESRILSSNVMPDKTSDLKRDYDDKEQLLKASQVTEETVEESILSVTPEPAEEFTMQESNTPTPHLRARLRYTEESYMELQEFTKLESECKEDEDKIQELMKEKENLLQDLIDLNIIIKDTRHEKEQIKMKLEDELIALKSDLDSLKKENAEQAIALERTVAQKDALKIEKNQILTDNEVLLEQQKLKYEKQLQYFTEEIEQLNKQERKVDYNFEQEMKLINEQETFIEDIASYKEKITQLEAKLQEFEIARDEDATILSVSTQTEKNQCECENLKGEMQKLNEKLEHLRSVNFTLEQKSSSFLEQIQTKDMYISEYTTTVELLQYDISENEQKIHDLIQQVRDLEEINVNQTRNIIHYVEDLKSTNRNVVNLHKQIAHLEGINQEKDDEVTLCKEKIQCKDNDICSLLSKIESLESCEEQIEAYKKELDSKTTEITNQANKITRFEEELELNSVKMNEQDALITSLQEKLTTTEMQILARVGEISNLTSKLEVVESENAALTENVKSKEMRIEANEIEISRFTKDVASYKMDIEKLEEEIAKDNDNESAIMPLQEEIEAKNKEILKLTGNIQNLEKENSHNKSLIDSKTSEITDQANKITMFEKELQLNAMKMGEQDSLITSLQEKLTTTEMQNNVCKQDINVLEDQILAGDREVLNLKSKLEVVESENAALIENVKCKEMKIEANAIEITRLQSTIDTFTKDVASYKKDIKKLEEEITKAKDNDNETEIMPLQEEMEAKNKELGHSKEEIFKLTEKIQNLEKENSHNKSLIDSKTSEITDQANKITKFEKELQLNSVKMGDQDSLITSLQEKLTTTEMQNNVCKQDANVLKDQILARDREILNLKSKLEVVQSENAALIENVKCKEMRIEANAIEITRLQSIIDTSTKDVDSYKKDINKLEEEIAKAKDKIVLLEETHDNESEIKPLQEEIEAKNKELGHRKEEILKLTTKIQNLKKENSRNKSLIANKITKFEDELKLNSVKINEQDSIITNLQEKLTITEMQNNICKQDINILEDQILARDREILNLKSENAALTKNVKCKKMRIEANEIEITRLQSTVDTFTNYLDSYKKDIKKLEKEIAKAEDKIVLLEETHDNESAIKSLQEEIEAKNKELGHSKEKIWKLTEKIQNLEKENSHYKSLIAASEDKFDKSDVPLETRNTRHSATSSSSFDMSPKEIRRRKRQSIHDQRRGIDLTASAVAEEEANDASRIVRNELQEKIKKLQVKIEDLTNENGSLEFEVQGFIRELDYYKEYNEEKERENDTLKMELEKMKKGIVQEDCSKCPQNQQYIKKLESLAKQNQFKLVDLQTKIYDLQNSHKMDVTYWDDKEKRLSYQISKLKERLGDKPPPELKDADVQCDVINYKELIDKYEKTKKVARMRREEGNILRARLGLPPDEPLQ